LIKLFDLGSGFAVRFVFLNSAAINPSVGISSTLT
jgi:hypothetical protein